MRRTVTVAALIAVLATASSAQVSGWRNDGSGKYPNADPPVHWDRSAKSVTELRSQASKPTDGDTGKPIADGVIREWLVLGPVPVPEGTKPQDDLLGGEADLAPVAGEKRGELGWKPVSTDASCVDFAALFNSYGQRAPAAAYACAWINAPSGRPVTLVFMSFGRGQAWLNGKSVFKAGEVSATRITLNLAKGWNRLMVKVVGEEKVEQWFLRAFMRGMPADDFESRGIAWTVHTPASGSSSPTILGDKLFVSCESGALACLNKSDGKLLWLRTITYCDAATAQERAAHADVFKDLDPLAATLREMDDAATKAPWSRKSEDERRKVEDQLNKGMAAVDKVKYGPSPRGEAGFSAPQPATDGKNVFVVFGSGLVASYAPDGTRRWLAVESHPNIEHGYTSSPLIVDGKLIVYVGDPCSLDLDTGAVVWERARSIHDSRNYSHFHGSGCVVDSPGGKLAFYPNNEFVRLSDGKAVAFDFFGLGWARIMTAVAEKGVLYKMQANEGGVLVIKPGEIADGKMKPQVLKTIPFNAKKFPRFYSAWHNASPLLHEGLMYCLNEDGVLTVVDVEKGEVVYQKLLDLDLYMHHNFGLGRGGAGSSPTLAGKYIYVFGNMGTSVVFEPGREYKPVARNRIDMTLWPGDYRERQEVFETCPVFEGKRMYLRGEENLYCVEEKP